MNPAIDMSGRLRRVFWATTVSSFLYLLAALACLRQWGSVQPWARLDVFSGGYLLLALVVVVGLAVGFNRMAFRSVEVLREAGGLSYDPKLTAWGTLLSIAELSVYLDYGHWRLVPALAQPAIQATGLGLALASAAWMLWTDSYLVRHFSGDIATRKVMTEGPYRHVRHPRYTSMIAGKLGFALALASIFGWLALVGWTALLLRRVRLEEAHLREVFGADYDAYTAQTARLLPGIY